MAVIKLPRYDWDVILRDGSALRSADYPDALSPTDVCDPAAVQRCTVYLPARPTQSDVIVPQLTLTLSAQQTLLWAWRVLTGLGAEGDDVDVVLVVGAHGDDSYYFFVKTDRVLGSRNMAIDLRPLLATEVVDG